MCGPYSRRRAYARRDLRAAESDLAVPGLRSEQREGMSGACGMESCARAVRHVMPRVMLFQSSGASNLFAHCCERPCSCAESFSFWHQPLLLQYLYTLPPHRCSSGKNATWPLAALIGNPFGPQFTYVLPGSSVAHITGDVHKRYFANPPHLSPAATESQQPLPVHVAVSLLSGAMQSS